MTQRHSYNSKKLIMNQISILSFNSTFSHSKNKKKLHNLIALSQSEQSKATWLTTHLWLLSMKMAFFSQFCSAMLSSASIALACRSQKGQIISEEAFLFFCHIVFSRNLLIFIFPYNLKDQKLLQPIVPGPSVTIETFCKFKTLANLSAIFLTPFFSWNVFLFLCNSVYTRNFSIFP